MINKLYVSGGEIARVLNFQRNTNGKNIIKTSLDGSVYAQSIGKSEIFAEVEIFAKTELIRNYIDYAAEQCQLFTVNYHNITYSGYIEDEIKWSWFNYGSSSTGKFKMRLVV